MPIKEKVFKVIIKPNAAKNEIIGFDKDKKAYRVNIKEKAEDNKANKELLRFLSRYLGKMVKIKSGLRSREKLIEVIDYSGGI